MSPTVSEHLAPYSPRALRAWRGDLPGNVSKEGTLVFADVAGCTRLTERLAKRGKAGSLRPRSRRSTRHAATSWGVSRRQSIPRMAEPANATGRDGAGQAGTS